MSKLCVFLSILCLAGCTTFGVSPRENRKLPTILSDSSIKVAVLSEWRSSDEKIYSDLELLVHEGRVLIVGRVSEPKQQIEAVRLAWKVKGVTEVIDEMLIGEKVKIREFAKDSFITAQMKTALTFNEYVNSLSYDYKTYAGVLYLIGVAQTEEELQHVLECAQNLSGVKEVVNHVRVKQ